MNADNFINIPFSIDNLDRYVVRTAIFNAMRNHMDKFNGKLLDVGCGKMPYKEYILANAQVEKYVGLDIESALVYDSAVKPDFFWDGNVMPFNDSNFETVLATEVLEHCPDPSLVLSEIYRVLKTDGIFFFTVPFLWPLHEVPHDEYRYTPFALERLLKNAGFTKIELSATGGWHTAMAQMIGLWLRRASMNKSTRNILSRAAMPVMKKLLTLDRLNEINFRESQMITGIYGIAIK